MLSLPKPLKLLSMKIKSKDYARALAEVILTGGNAKKISDGFLAILKDYGAIKKAQEIIGLAEEMLLEKSGNKKVVIESARKTMAGKSFIKKGDMLEEIINSNLVAGVRIIINGERQLDFSLKRKLDNIF